MLNEIDTSHILHYLIFGFFLAIILVDHRRILTTVITKKEPDSVILEKKKPTIIETKTDVPIYEAQHKQPKMITAADKNFEVKGAPETFLKNVKALFDELQSKTKKLEALENEIEERREKLIEQEKLFKDHIKSYSESKEKSDYFDKDVVREIPAGDQILIQEKIKDQLLIDNKIDCIAILHRGVLKKINNCFANLLGYQPEELVNKNLFVFIAPDGIEEVKKHYLGRLRGNDSDSYKTVFLKKDKNTVWVEITAELVIYNGETAEIIVIKEI